MKKYVILILAITGLMMINNCAHRQVIEANNTMVKNCTFIGTVSSSFNSPDEGKKYVMNQAAEKGATHVIIKLTAEGKKSPGKYNVSARCYQCDARND
jgi:hypothetical protein